MKQQRLHLIATTELDVLPTLSSSLPCESFDYPAAEALPFESHGEEPRIVATLTTIRAPCGRFLRRVARFFGAGKGMPNIKQLGLYAILSYGFVSNASYAICTGIAWYLASKKTGARIAHAITAVNVYFSQDDGSMCSHVACKLVSSRCCNDTKWTLR